MIQGYVNTKLEIVKLKFSKTNKLTLFLKDGGEICFPRSGIINPKSTQTLATNWW